MTVADFLPLIDDLRAAGKATAADVYAQVTTIVTRAATIGAAVAAYEAKAAARVAVPFDEVLATVRAIDVDPLPSTNVSLLETVTRDLDYPLALVGVLRDLERALFDTGALRRAFASQVTPTAGTTNVFVGGGDPYVPYRLRQGDTLERLAASTLGNVERAYEIVALNGLAYPYLETARDYVPAEFDPEAFAIGEFAIAGAVDRAGVPANVRVTGEVLWLPSDATVPATQTFTDRDVELWGRDLKLEGGFLALTDDAEAEVVAGKDNIVQALGQRIATTRGEFVLHPTYGMETLLAVGVEGTRANMMVSGMVTARAIKDDPRVTAVRDIAMFLRDTVNRADMRISLIGASDATVPLNLVIPESVA